jgi:branched-chain amino acid transport system substrate-binding protein
MKSKKFGMVLMTLGLSASMLLTACGGPADQPATTAPTTAATQGTSGGEGGTIKIVSSLPRTGLSKTQTDDVVTGIKQALEEHNNKAGNFTIVYEDWDDATAQAGRWDAATEASNATKASNDPDVMVYIGTFNSGAAAVAIPILNKAGLAMISPANTAPELTKKGFDDKVHDTLYTGGTRNYFRVVTADDVQGAAAANWATELGFKNAYVLNDQEVYGKGVANVFQKQFTANGGAVISNEGYDPKQAEFRSLMTKVKDSGADLVYCGCLVDSGGPQLLKDLKAVAPEIQFMGPDGIQTQAFIDAAGADVAAGTYATVAGKDVKDLPAAGQKFYEDFKAKSGGKDPDPYAIYGYEAMNVALQAIEKVGKKDRAAILNALKEVKDYQGALGTWSFDENGDTTLTDIRGFKVEGGKFVYQKNLKVNP